MGWDLVVPTAGRPSLRALLEALDRAAGPPPGRLIVVDDRPEDAPDPPHGAPGLDELLGGLTNLEAEVLSSGGRGPAAARNAGWRAASAEWVAFLDDDVVPPPGWPARLARDLEGLGPDVAASQGRVRVPLPAHRRPTDWERNVAGLEHARWATADMAFRREALRGVGGFDERFGRAYREDADLGLRLTSAGWKIASGEREVVHPVGPAGPWKSLSLQAGNADDVLMDRKHGRGWRARAGAPRGRLRRHQAVAGAGVAALGAALAGRRTPAVAAGLGWLAGTGELAWRRIAPGPRTPRELATMLATSALMPFVAGVWRVRGHLRHRAGSRPDAVLLDRDGTLVEDIPYNGDPARVRPMPGAEEALRRLRASGVELAVVSNQSGIGRGLLTPGQVEAVNRRVDELLGPLGPWVLCPHAPEDGCDCRKPAPGLVRRAAELLDVAPERCAVVGDIGADVEAARAAGARGVLVPTARTREEEIAAADEVAPDLPSAVSLLMGEAA